MCLRDTLKEPPRPQGSHASAKKPGFLKLWRSYMKLVKSLLLGSAAALAAVSGAQAADLPARKAAPVDYVRVCSAYGNGFFFIPGTETCLRIGGRVRAEYLYSEPFSRGADAIGFRARGRLNVDARTNTAYGTLRAFFRYELTRNTGTYRFANTGGSGFVTGYSAVNGFARNAGDAGVDSQSLDKAFIQFAGITAGRATSFFDFYSNDLNWGFLRGSDQNTQNLLAYTASFGGGFTATVSLEDRQEREAGLAAATYAGQEVLAGPGGASNVVSTLVYGGQRMPDVVGALRIDQAWGSAQLSGALRQITTSQFVTPAGTPLTALGRSAIDSEFGFAVQGGVKINLPMIAAGDVLWLQAAYADGAISYLGYGNFFGIPNSRAGLVNVTNTDALIDPLGNVKTTKGWAVTAAFLHYWTPQVRQAVFASYSQLEYAKSVTSAYAGAGLGLPGVVGVYNSGAIVDNDELRIGTNLIWSPVRDLDIGVEVLYTRVDPKGRMISAKSAAVLPAVAGGTTTLPSFYKAKGADDAWQARLRIQRDF
jgi:Porin subfamily